MLLMQCAIVACSMAKDILVLIYFLVTQLRFQHNWSSVAGKSWRLGEGVEFGEIQEFEVHVRNDLY